MGTQRKGVTSGPAWSGHRRRGHVYSWRRRSPSSGRLVSGSGGSKVEAGVTEPLRTEEFLQRLKAALVSEDKGQKT